jgi:hypothetical protein
MYDCRKAHRLAHVIVKFRCARLTTKTRQEVLGETLNMRLGKWLEAVPFEEIKDALTEEWRDQADVVSEVKVLQQGDAFAANTRGPSR